MAKKAWELKQERTTKQDDLKRMQDATEKENRNLSTEEKVTWDSLQGEIRGLNDDIRRAEEAEALELEIARRTANPVVTDKGDGEGAEKRKMLEGYSIHKVLRSQLHGIGHLPLSGVELELHQEAQQRAQVEGITMTGVGVPTELRNPMFKPEKRGGQSVTGDGGIYGAALVATEQQRDVIEFLRPNPVIAQLGARYNTGLTGNLEFIVNKGGITANWQGEKDSATESQNEYGTVNSTPKRLTSKVLISLMNIMQSTPDLERMTLEDINAVVALKLDQTAISGIGTGFIPMGILNASGTNSVAAGANGGDPTFAQIVSAGVKVRSGNAVLPGAKFGWLVNPETTGKLQTTQKVSGQAIFLMGEDGRINGYPSKESTLMPNNLAKGTHTTTDLSAAIFGDWNQFMINQWGWYDLTIDQVTKKSEGQIQIILNSFYDMFVRQAKAFTVIKDWVTV